MTVQAISWVLDHSESGGNDRLVAISLANNTDRGTWIAGPTLKVVAGEARVSVRTVQRSLERLVTLGEIEDVTAKKAPSWWKSLPPNKRPRLWHWVADGVNPQLGCQSVTPEPSTGVTLGCHGGDTAMSPIPVLQTPNDNKAAANASASGADGSLPPCSGDATLVKDPNQRERAAARRKAAKEVTDAFWEWVTDQTGHRPPESHQAICGIVDQALAADFTVTQIKRGLAAIQGRRPRRPPITRQTLWDAISDAGQGHTGPSGAADWIEAVEAVNRENAEARVRAGEGDPEETR